MLNLSLVLFSLFGGLTWQDENVSVKADVDAAFVRADFRFENKGKSPVKILDVKRSCGCQTIKLKKMEYSPGESGKIEVEVKVEDMVGIVERTVTVKTDDGDEKNLTAKITVPKPAEAVPGNLSWSLDKPAAAKQVKITATKGISIRPVEAKCRHTAIAADYKVAEEGQVVILTVEPKDLGGSLLSEVALTLEVREGKKKAKKEIRIPVVLDYD